MSARRFALHCVLLLADLVAAGAACELLLRHDLDASRQERTRPAGEGGPPVVFLGDSHFFGLWMTDEQTMPSQAAVFSRECDRQGFVALNRSRGGSTTWILLEDARDLLPRVKPKAVVVRAGVTNRLNLDPERARWWERLHVVNLARRGARDAWNRLAGRGPVNTASDFDVGLPRDEIPSENAAANERGRVVFQGLPALDNQDYDRDVSPGVRRDLTALSELARSQGIPVYFVSYLVPGDVFSRISDDLAEVARATGAKFVDVRPTARRALLEARRADIVFHDGHPSRLGYALEARELLQAMVRDGVLTGPPLEEPLTWLTRQPLEPTPARLRGEARVEKVLGASSPTFLVKGRAGGRGTLFAGAFGRGTPFGTEGVALRDEDVTRCLQSEACHFVLDGGGEARVVLPSDLAAALPAGAVATALVYGRELPTPSIAVAPYVDAATGASREPPGSRAAPR